MSELTLFPAIDLLGGKVVRLQQGDRSKATIYSDDPAAVAASFREQGAEWIHVVDLDAAFDGPTARQIRVIERIATAAGGIPIQLGGGLREFDIITRVLDDGIARLLIGTAAVENRVLLQKILYRFGPERIAVAVDESGGAVKVRGWVSGDGPRPDAFARELAAEGIRWFLHSAITRDGTFAGPDMAALERVALAVAPLGGRVICAGGIGTVEHLRALRLATIPGVAGAVTGRALYEKAFTVAEARAALSEAG